MIASAQKSVENITEYYNVFMLLNSLRQILKKYPVQKLSGKKRAKGNPRAIGSGVTSGYKPEDLANNFRIREKEFDFLGSSFRRIRTVNRVFTNGQGEILANGALCGLGRVGCTHNFAVSGNRVFTF